MPKKRNRVDVLCLMFLNLSRFWFIQVQTIVAISYIYISFLCVLQYLHDQLKWSSLRKNIPTKVNYRYSAYWIVNSLYKLALKLLKYCYHSRRKLHHFGKTDVWPVINETIKLMYKCLCSFNGNTILVRLLVSNITIVKFSSFISFVSYQKL